MSEESVTGSASGVKHQKKIAVSLQFMASSSRTSFLNLIPALRSQLTAALLTMSSLKRLQIILTERPTRSLSNFLVVSDFEGKSKLSLTDILLLRALPDHFAYCKSHSRFNP